MCRLEANLVESILSSSTFMWGSGDWAQSGHRVCSRSSLSSHPADPCVLVMFPTADHAAEKKMISKSFQGAHPRALRGDSSEISEEGNEKQEYWSVKKSECNNGLHGPLVTSVSVWFTHLPEKCPEPGSSPQPLPGWEVCLLTLSKVLHMCPPSPHQTL